jgi:hypothetical protein
LAKILPKRSSTGGVVPSTSNLADGEIAINYADRKIYGRSGNDILVLADINQSSVGGASPFAFAALTQTTPSKQYTGMTASAMTYVSGTSSFIDFTFDSAQPNTDYAVMTDYELTDFGGMDVTNKTVNGFRVNFYDTSGTPVSDTNLIGTYRPIIMVYSSNLSSGGVGSTMQSLEVNLILN